MINTQPIRPNDEDEYTEVARLTNHYAATLTARIDYANRLTILGDEINNDGVPQEHSQMEPRRFVTT